jgi:hypothetical protein
VHYPSKSLPTQPESQHTHASTLHFNTHHLLSYPATYNLVAYTGPPAPAAPKESKRVKRNRKFKEKEAATKAEREAAAAASASAPTSVAVTDSSGVASDAEAVTGTTVTVASSASSAPASLADDDDIEVDDEPINRLESDSRGCFCDKPLEGKVVRCDGADCEYRFLQAECAGFTSNKSRKKHVASEETWFCVKCSEEEARKRNSEMATSVGSD